MKVEHQDLDKYFDDIERAKKKYDHVFVRSEIIKDEKNSGVLQVKVISGFHDEEYLYELTLNCGENLVGGGNEAINNAVSAIEKIEEKCNKAGVECGGGRWHL